MDTTVDNIDITPFPVDTFISEKVEVEVKEGDTVDDARIRHLITAETDKFVGSISDLKRQIGEIENQKAYVTRQMELQVQSIKEASIQGQLTLSKLEEQIGQLDSLSKEKQASIDKYLPEVEAKIRERQP